MKRYRALLASFGLLTACSDDSFEVVDGQQMRLSGCDVVFHGYTPFLTVDDSCRPGGGYTVGDGECALIGERYYCVESLDPPRLRPAYRTKWGGKIILAEGDEGDEDCE